MAVEMVATSRLTIRKGDATVKVVRARVRR